MKSLKLDPLTLFGEGCRGNLVNCFGCEKEFELQDGVVRIMYYTINWEVHFGPIPFCDTACLLIELPGEGWC